MAAKGAGRVALIAPMLLAAAVRAEEPARSTPSQPATPTPTFFGGVPAPPDEIDDAPADEPPDELPFTEGNPAPRGYRLERRPDDRMLVLGFGTVGVAYTLGLLVGAGDKFAYPEGWLILPIGGPWVALAERRDAGFLDLGGIGYALDGALQVAGSVAVIAAYTAPRTLWVREHALSIRPLTIGQRSYGLALGGAF